MNVKYVLTTQLSLFFQASWPIFYDQQIFLHHIQPSMKSPVAEIMTVSETEMQWDQNCLQ